MDVMPDAAMYDIIETPTKVSSSEVTQIVKDAGLDASVKKMTCYCDDHGYWFCENRGRSKSKSTSKKGKSNSKSRSRSGSNNGTNRRKTRGKSRGK